MIVKWLPIFQSVALFCIAYAIILLFQFLWSTKRLFYLGNKFNGPDILPFFKYVLKITTTTKHSKIEKKLEKTLASKMLDFIKGFKKLSISPEHVIPKFTLLIKLFGRNTVRIFIGWDLYLFIVNPEDAKIVLNKALTKPYLYSFTQSFAGEGIFNAPVSKWKCNRKLLNPAFRVSILKTYINIFNAQSRLMINNLVDNENNTEFSMCKHTHSSTFKILMESLVGFKMAPAEVKNTVEYFYEGQTIVFGRIIRIWEHFDFIFNKTKNGKKVAMYIKYLHYVINKKLIEKKVLFQSNTSTNDLKNNGQEFMDIMLKGEHKWTDKEIRDEVSTLAYAGTDTSANVMGFLFMMLGIHQDVQENCFNEIFEIFGDSDRDAESQDLEKMKYLERCIKETMRMFPVVPLIARKVLEDTKISDGVIPAGANVVIFIQEMHRDPIAFPNPSTFDADRFLPENIKKRHPHSFMPFSVGPRNCIGLTYAMMSMLVIVSHILRQYHVFCDKKVDDIQILWYGISKAVGGFPVRLKHRRIRI